MNKCVALLTWLIFIFSTKTAFCQVPILDWYKCYGGSRGEIAMQVRHTSDGGYVIGGYTSSDNNGDVAPTKGANDFWIVKCSRNGNIQWQITLGGGYIDQAEDIVETPDGGYIVAGFSHLGIGGVFGGYGSSDFWVIKLGSNGDIQWTKCYGGIQADYAFSIDNTQDGGYVIAGYAESNDGLVIGHYLARDFWVIKIDAVGNLVWQNCFGGSWEDELYSIKATGDGGCIVAGTSASPEIINPPSSIDGCVFKLDVDGNIQWQKVIGGSRAEILRSIKETPDGGYILAGESASSDGDVGGNKGGLDYWIVKLNSYGNIEWERNYGGSGDESAQEIIVAENGGYLIAGYTNSTDGDVSCNNGETDAWVIKLNISGDMIWQKNFGSSLPDRAFTVAQIGNGKYIVGGSTESVDLDGFHQSLDATGGLDLLIFQLSEVNFDSVQVAVSGPLQLCGVENPEYLSKTNFPAARVLYEWKLNGIVVGNTSAYSLPFKNDAEIICIMKVPASCTNAEYVFTDTVNVKACVTKNFVALPNAFTPNNDGKNDIFIIPPGSAFQLKEFCIFDRWGKKVFSTKNISSGWNGNIGGKPADAGSYVFLITGESQSKPIVHKGNLVLVR